MDIINAILIIISIICLIVFYGILLNMPKDFFKIFKESCKESISKRDKEIEERKKINKELRNWLFK